MNCVMRTRLIGHLCVLSLQDDWGPICGGSGRRYRQRVSQIPSTQPRRNCLRERTSIVALEPVAKDMFSGMTGGAAVESRSATARSS